MDLPLTALAMYIAQEGLCFHCGEPMLMAHAAKASNGQYSRGWTREHVQPISKGGRMGYRNVVLAHLSCNNKRGNTAPTQGMLERAAQIRTKTRWMLANNPELKREALRRQTAGTSILTTQWAGHDYDPGPGEPRFDPKSGGRSMVKNSPAIERTNDAT